MESTKSPEKVGESALVVVNEARSIVINSNDDYEKAMKIWAHLVQMMKNIEEAYDDIIDANHKAWKRSLAKKAHYFSPVKQEATLLKSRMSDYAQEKERLRKIEEDQKRELAIKEAEDNKLQEAEANPDIADQILSEPISVAPVVVAKDLPTGGPVFRKVWSAEVYDLELLIQAVANKQIGTIALLPNEVFLGQQARSFKEHLNIPGVRAFSKMV